MRKDLKEIGLSWEGLQKEAINRQEERGVYIAFLGSDGLVLQ